MTQQYLTHPVQNIHNPERQKELETFDQYKARRKASHVEVKNQTKGVPVARSEPKPHSKKQKTVQARKESQIERASASQQPKFEKLRVHKPHEPTQPFVTLVGREPRRQWCPERKPG